MYWHKCTYSTEHLSKSNSTSKWNMVSSPNNGSGADKSWLIGTLIRGVHGSVYTFSEVVPDNVTEPEQIRNHRILLIPPYMMTKSVDRLRSHENVE